MKKSWMVWKVDGGFLTHRHDSRASAKVEAERLTKEYGGVFVVLEAVLAVKRAEVEWRRLNELDDDITF